jgi:hypothetical protein
MTRKTILMAALAVALTAPLAAHAQQTDQAAPVAPAAQPAPDATTPAQPMPAQPMPATQAGTPASATVGDPTTNAAQPTADATGAQVVSNGPVPDTRANRMKYGKPMSSAGRHTAPAGN